MTVSDHRADRRIVVGVDGSRASQIAVDWALREAVVRHAALRLVHAVPWPVRGEPAPSRRRADPVDAPTIAGDVLAERREHARELAPDLPVDTRLVDGYAAAELVRESRTAALLVLGQRGLGGFAGLALGSVAGYVAAHAHGPVLVVPADATARATVSGQVVLGVDGSAVGATAVTVAFEEAAWRAVPLTVVHAWSAPGGAARLYDPDRMAAEGRRVVADALAGWPDKYPDLELRREVVRGSPAAALMAELSPGDLLVVGARGLGGFRDQHLGSVVHTLLHHVPCPVLVVRPSHR
jgi:nucleotide-binding universal stress UspA family protein